jgi:hypothetical protein
MNVVDVKIIKEKAQVFGHLGCRVAGSRHFAEAVTAKIVEDDAPEPRKSRCATRIPECRIGGEAMNHHKVRPGFLVWSVL